LLDIGISASHVEWETGIFDLIADQVIAASNASKPATPDLDEAKEFLKDIVGREGEDFVTIQEQAKKAGLSWATVRPR
jgi:hypothetical protein